jgi:hypothetical protein
MHVVPVCLVMTFVGVSDLQDAPLTALAGAQPVTDQRQTGHGQTVVAKVRAMTAGQLSFR